MAVSFWQRRDRAPEIGCDVAIVGAGVIGVSTAFWLARAKPDCRIFLIDAGKIAAGASGRNAGFLLQGASSDYVKDCAAFGRERARRLWRFTRENRDLILKELSTEAFDLESSGAMFVAGTEEEDRRLRESVQMMRADGLPSTYFAPRETNERLSARGFLGSVYVPSGAMLDPVRLVRQIAARSNATLLEHARVRSIEPQRSGVLVSTERRPVRADRVVLAINAWTPKLFPDLARLVQPRRAQMLATAAAGGRTLDVPVYSHDGYFYVRQTSAGAVLVGGARHLHLDEEVGYEESVTRGLQRDLESYLSFHFPQFRTLPVETRWSGIMGFSPDHLPVVGDLPGLPGSVWAAGFTGHGMGYGFRFGKMLAELVARDAEPEGLDLFTADRFAVEAKRDRLTGS